MNHSRVNTTLSIAVIVLSLFFYSTCSKFAQVKKDIKAQADYYKGNEQRFINKINSLGEEVNRQNVVIVQSKQAEKQLRKEVADLKRLKSKVDVQIVTMYDSVVISHTDTLKDPNTIRVPKVFRYNTNGLSFTQTITKQFIRLDSIQISNGLSITVGKFKTGLLKSEYQAEVKLDNPFSEVRQMKSVIVKENNRKPFFAGLGIGAAIVASLLIISR